MSDYMYTTALGVNSTTNPPHPSGPTPATAMATTFSKTFLNINPIAPSRDQYAMFRFWLNISNAAQPAGNYTNTILFSVPAAGSAC